MFGNLDKYYKTLKKDFEDTAKQLVSLLHMAHDNQNGLGQYIYKVTYRVKEIESLKRKLKSFETRRRNESDFENERNFKQLQESDELTTELLRFLFSRDGIVDLIGIRLVCFHKRDIFKITEEVLKRLKNNGFNIEFKKVCLQRGAKLEDYWIEPGFKPEDRDSGYRAVHIYVTLPKNHQLNINDRKDNKVLNKLECEIQVLSLIQHTWAEINHASYKLKQKNKRVVDMYTIFGNQLHACDDLSSQVAYFADEAQKDYVRRWETLPKARYHFRIKEESFDSVCKDFMLNKEELRFTLNLLKTYYNTIEVELANIDISDEEEIHRIHEKGKNTLYEILEKLQKNSGLRPHIELELAYLYIMMGRLGYKNLYKNYLKDKNKVIYFWANFRFSFILQSEQNFEMAIKHLENAIKIIDNPKYYNKINSLYEVDGLKANLYTNISHLYKQYSEYYKEDKPPRFKELTKKVRKFGIQAYELSKNVKRDDVRLLVKNNYIYYITENIFRKSAKDEDLNDIKKSTNRIYLHTYAQYNLYKGMKTNNKNRKKEYFKEAHKYLLICLKETPRESQFFTIVRDDFENLKSIMNKN